MNSSEFMDLSLEQWEEIARSHPVSNESMMEFVEDIIEKADTRAPLDLSLEQLEEISRSHPVSDESMMEFLEDIIEKADTRVSPSRKTKYMCEHCAREFTTKSNLQRHLKIHAQKKEFNCSTCARTFYRKDKKREHETKCSRREAKKEQVESSTDITSENQTGGGSTASENSDEDCQSALDGNLKSIQMKPRENEKYDLSIFLQGKRTNVLRNVERELKEKKGVKWFISVQVEMVKYNTELEDVISQPHFRSQCQRLLHVQDLPEQYLNCVEKVKESFEMYQREGSGWQLKQVRKFLLNFSFVCVIFSRSLKYAVQTRSAI